MIRNIGKPYAEVVASFRWDGVLAELGWANREAVNLAETCIDRHCAGEKAQQTALVWLGKDGTERHLSYRELSEESARFANLLGRLGVRKGDRVATFMPRVPETFIAIFGILKAGAVFVPIFTGFGADAVRYRLEHSGAKVLCTHEEQRDQVGDVLLSTVICIAAARERLREGDIDFKEALSRESAAFAPVLCRRDEPAAIIYTSGSTGPPKGCVIAVNLLAAIWPYIRYGVNLREESDFFWPTGDPGWGYGLCCYLPAFAAGAKVLSVQANPNAKACIHMVAQYGVTNLATTPTLLRAVMALGEHELSEARVRVRAISSCGEPLNSEVVEFFRRVWGVTPMDHFGATEFSLPIGNMNGAAMTVKPGSMGLPFPGHEMAVIDDAGRELATGEIGLLAQKTSQHSLYWMCYWNDGAATASVRRDGWACTGDLASRDADGYFWFEGRSDDIIKSAGYRIGPFEVESAILKHPGVAEAAVVGKADALRAEIVKAFVVLKAGVEASTKLADDIARLVRENVGSHQYPREIEFVSDLPKTQTGKIQRFLLRQRG